MHMPVKRFCSLLVTSATAAFLSGVVMSQVQA